MHWFLHSRGIHAWISLSTLTFLAIYAFYHSYSDDEEFMDKYGAMLPPLTHVFWHPIQFWKSLIEVFRLQTIDKSIETRERRTRGLEDIDKRKFYRKEHGLESEGFWSGWKKEDLKGMPREKWHEEEDAAAARAAEEAAKVGAAAEVGAVEGAGSGQGVVVQSGDGDVNVAPKKKWSIFTGFF